MVEAVVVDAPVDVEGEAVVVDAFIDVVGEIVVVDAFVGTEGFAALRGRSLAQLS